VAQTITKDTIRKIYDNVRADPLAGRGYLAPIDIFIDRLLAHLSVDTLGQQSAPKESMFPDAFVGKEPK
jgi:hypothetical protein